MALDAPAKEAILDRIGNVFAESACLSTCNRLEFFLAAESLDTASDVLADSLAKVLSLTSDEIQRRWTSYADEDAVRHLFRLAAGLESMVPGDAQILGQVKQTFQEAQSAGTVGRVFNLLFQRAFAAAKKVRHQTGLGKGRLSISALAVECARERLGCLREAITVVIGAGKMGQLTAKYLRQAGAKEIRIVNRGIEAAQELAQSIGAKAYSLDNLTEALHDANLVISGTASPQPLITKELLGESGYASQGCLLIDIALPPDIDPAVGHLDRVELIEMEYLRIRAQRNQRNRKAELERANAIVHEELNRLGPWPLPFHMDELAKRMGEYAAAIYQEEISQLFTTLPGLTPEQQATIDQRMKRMAERIVLAPRRNLRRNTTVRSCPEALQCISEIFLEPDDVRARPKTIQPTFTETNGDAPHEAFITRRS